MKCPNCGGEVSDSGGRCPNCKTALPSSIATGVLTPLASDDAETVYAGPSRPAARPPQDADTADTTGLPLSAGGVRHVSTPPKVSLGPLKVTEKFGSRYTILRQLGIGGMGAVYQAWDAELNVAVALKVIRPEAAQDKEAAQDIERRFKQELLLARQVTHKNVVRIHDLGEIDGIKYITMPFIDGADLATVLRDTPKLSIAKVMSIIREIAAGLQAAHEAGVVHRDLKPANVMIENDHAIIMDFGIARSTSRVGSMPSAPTNPGTASGLSIDEALTRAAATVVGAVIGTIEYMAPEQARGEHVDQRADIYAFGLIVYDMLAGRRRVDQAPSAVFELQKRMAQPPPSVRTLAPHVPAALDQLVTRCIEPDAAKRFQTAAELVAAIGRLDDRGKLRPIKRVVGLPFASAIAMVLLGLSGGVWWYNRPPVQHDPVQVVIADIENRTNDPTFNRILEPMLKRALEGASFITAYDRDYMRRTLGVQPPEELNEDAARSVAVQQGLGVVLAGFLEPQGRGYRVSVRASQAVTGDVITTEQDIAGNKDAVLETATRLMTRVRNALGDEASESAQMFAMMTMTTTSLDVVRLYADAMAATSTGKFEDARQALLKAIELDPKFGLAYSSLAGVSRNLGRLQDADKYINEALRYLDGMTERERFNTRGTYARLSGDYQQCVEQFGELITRFAADAIAYNQRALCLSKLRQMREAVEDMRKAVQILPKRVVLRDNLALYANYGGDFLTGEQEARGVEEPDVFTVMALAFAQLGQGLPREAESTYKQLESMGVLGASLAASGYGDVALYDGRFADAVRIFQEGAAADLKADLPDRAAAKFTWLAHAEMSRRREAAAAAAADEALKHSNAANIRFLAGRIYVGVGDAAKARRIIATLAKEPLAEPRAYGKIVEGELALKNRDPQGAIQMLREANELFDTWIGRFVLGQAYLAEGSRNSLLQADSEFDTCLNKRRGEALSLFLDEEPTYGYLPAVYYYQGRARDGIGTEGFRDSYRQYLAIRGSSTDDPLGADVRKRIASTKP